MTNSCPRCRADNPETQRFCGECGTSLFSGSMTETLRTPAHELKTGSTFAGRYQVIEELGKGGMGRVYKVLDTKINEKVALKLIKPEIASDRETLERFANEMKLARKIGHRNVCRMFDLGEADGLHFLTMEYVPGEDLKSMIRMSGTLGIGAVLSIGKQIADGLAEAHRLGIVHRDLKPQNVMIDKGGNAKIMDFGIARLVLEKGPTGPSVMIGTPEYMSPEQAEAKGVDERSDIYSLGIILYEMATGRVPFEGETALSVAMKHKGETPKDPRRFNPAIPEDLGSLILKCLEKDKTRRYTAAAEVRSELEKIEQGIPTTERTAPKPRAGTSREITVKLRPKTLVVPALAIVLVAAALAIVFRIFPGKRAAATASNIPSLAILYFKNNTGDVNLDFWRSALAESLITDMSQSKYIRVLSWDEVYGTLKELDLLEAQGYTTDELSKVAQNGQAEYILQGGLSRAGDKYRIETTLRRITPGSVSAAETARVEGTGEQSIYAMIDELTKKIKASLKLSPEQIANDLDYEIGQITTRSPEALKYFNQAFELQRGTRFAEAAPLLEKAIEIDPEFAMAYWGLVQGNATGSAAELEAYYEKALALSGRLPDRERWRIEQTYYSRSERTAAKGIEILSKILEVYPWDQDAVNDLGIRYMGYLEDYRKAIETYESIFKYFPVIRWPLFVGNLSVFYQQTGQLEKALKINENFLKNVGDDKTIHYNLGQIYLQMGRFDPALAEADKILLLDPSWYDADSRGRIYQAEERWADAEKEFRKSLEKGDRALLRRAKASLASLFRQQGQFEKARTILEEMWKPGGELGELPENSIVALNSILTRAYAHLRCGSYDSAIRILDRLDALAISSVTGDMTSRRLALWLKGLTLTEADKYDEAEKVAAELGGMIGDSLNKKQAERLSDHLLGSLALARGDLMKAIARLERARGLLPGLYGSGYGDAHPMFLSPLGEAYFRRGEYDKARAAFEAVSRGIMDAYRCGDLWAKSFYWLGKIAEKQGVKSEAIAQYRRFLDLWKNADPGLPEVEEAKARLKALL